MTLGFRKNRVNRIQKTEDGRQMIIMLSRLKNVGLEKDVWFKKCSW
jgi:hypothetical protein